MVKSISNVCNVNDDFLNIKTETEERDILPDRKIFFEYVPTNYLYLENLFTKYPFDADDHIVDFGCGKGRVLFMAAYYSCKYITGYELDIDRYNILLENIKNFQNKFNSNSIFSTFNTNVENICVDDSANKFFFFNPFHLKVYIRVLDAIQASLQRNKRNIYIFLYHPMDSTIKYIDSLGHYNKIEIIERYKTNNETHNSFEHVVYSNK